MRAAAIDTACSDSDDDSIHVPSLVVPAAKRTSAPEGSSPAYKARRRLQDVHAMRHLRTSPKIANGQITDKVERLEPTETLEQRLCFVSCGPSTSEGSTGYASGNGSNSEAEVCGLVRQMQSMSVTHEPQIQELIVAPNVPLSNGSDGVATAEKTLGRDGLWRICVTPGSEKAIHTTEEDGWQIVDEYKEKAQIRLSPSASPETSDTEPLHFVAPSKNTPVLTRSDTSEHFQWMVQNLPYSAPTYSVSLDIEKRQIVIKTSNRKYYKRIDVPELIDCGLQLDEKLLTWRHSQETLTVLYFKTLRTDS